MKDDLKKLGYISIVAPAYNEEKALPHFYEKIKSVMEKIGINFEVIIVENGSTDGTLDILKKFNREDSRFKYLSLSRNFGHQGGLTAGLEYASGDAVICMDADLQHPPELIPKMLELWEDGYDVVYTVKRFNKAQPLLRRIFDRLFYSIVDWLSGMKLHGQSDFRMMSRRAVDVLCVLPERNKFLRGLTAWIGFRQTGIMYDVSSRIAGLSKFHLRHVLKFALDGILSFSVVPLRLFTLLGMLISAGSFFYGIFLLLFKIYTVVSGRHDLFPPGWPSVACVILFFGGIQLIGIGLLGEYLGRVYDEVKARPPYIVKETVCKKREEKKDS